jgi:hypothetical protein
MLRKMRVTAVGEWVGAWTLDAFRLHALAGCCIVHAACASQAGAQRNLFFSKQRWVVTGKMVVQPFSLQPSAGRLA